jgi:hypothetical protein
LGGRNVCGENEEITFFTGLKERFLTESSVGLLNMGLNKNFVFLYMWQIPEL